MKKEKTIRTYQRRTKTGKIVTVKQHTAKYDAAEAMREAAKKKGAGDELEALKKKKPAKTSKVAEETPKSDSSYGFSADDYKAWYHWDQDADPKNKSALKVEKALKKQMGTKAYNKYFDEMSDSYSSRGHNKAFKGLSDTFSAGNKNSKERSKEIAQMVEDRKSQMKKAGIDPDKRLTGKKATDAKKDLVSKGFIQKKGEHNDTYLMKGKEVYRYIPSGTLVGGAHLDKITGGKDYDKAKKLFGEKVVTSSKDIKAAQEAVDYFTRMIKDKRFSHLSKKDQQHYKSKLAAEKALLKTLQSGKASSDIDDIAQKIYDKAYKTSKEAKSSKDVAPKESKEEKPKTKTIVTPKGRSTMIKRDELGVIGKTKYYTDSVGNVYVSNNKVGVYGDARYKKLSDAKAAEVKKQLKEQPSGKEAPESSKKGGEPTLGKLRRTRHGNVYMDKAFSAGHTASRAAYIKAVRAWAKETDAGKKKELLKKKNGLRRELGYGTRLLPSARKPSSNPSNSVLLSYEKKMRAYYSGKED